MHVAAQENRPVTKVQLFILSGIFAAAMAVRFGSLPHQPFFCDVPENVAVVESGKMHTTAFPGYAAFHWMIRFASDVTGNAFTGDILFCLLCGLGAMTYCTLFAFQRGGFHGAVLASVLIGFSPIAVYFSTVGASYVTDLLGMSAVIYHGFRALKERSDGHFRWAVVWFCFACLMRPLSFPFAFPGIVYLLWRSRTKSNLLFTMFALAAGAIICGSLMLYYLGGLAGVRNSLGAPQGAVIHSMSFGWIAGNEIRYLLFTVWSLNIFCLIIPAFLWKARRYFNHALGIFILLLTLPYASFMLWYIPHAGYVCLLLPAFLCAPWVAEKRLWLETRFRLWAALFVVLSLLQFFAARPIPFKGTASLVLNTYVLTYTHQGMERGMFGNYQQWLAWMQGKTLAVPARGTHD